MLGVPKKMKIIATSEELKDLRNLFIQGFTSLDDKDREQFNKEVKRLNHIVSNKDKAIKELQQANNDLIYKLNQNRAIVTRLEKSNNSYENELKEVIDKLNKKQAAETILEDRIKDLESDPRLSTGFDDFIEGFKEDVTCDLKKELEILKTDYASLLTDKEEFKKNVDYWKSEHGDKVLEIEKLEKKIKSIQDKTPWVLEKNNQELQQEIKNLHDIINLKERDIEDIVNSKINLIEKNHELKTKLEQAEKSSYIQGTTKDIFTIPQDKYKLYSSYKLDNNSLDSNNSIGTIYHNPINIELQKENNELKEQLKEKKEVINKIHNDNKKLTAANNGLYIQANKIKRENKLRYYQTKVDSLVSKLTPSEADNNTWITINYETIKEFISSLDNSINSVIFETKFTSLDNLHESIISIIKFIESRIVTLESSNNRLKETNENLNSELNDIKQVLKQSNVELKDELNLKNEVLELQSKVFKLQETNNKLNQDNQRLYNQNCDLSLNLNKIKSENDIIKNQRVELFQSIERLSKEIESLNLENSKVYHRNKELEETSKKFLDLNTKLETKNKELANDILKTNK